jgi:hypothetical protein
VQLAIEYDPQPPYDSGHTSKASAATKAAATAQLSMDTVRQGQVLPSTRLLWDAAIHKLRVGRANARSQSVRAPKSLSGWRK